MKVFFLGGFYPQEHINQIRSDSIGAIANANNALQWGFIEGLQEHFKSSINDVFEIISIPQIGAYPLRYKKISFKAPNQSFGKKQDINGTCCSFNNIIGFKYISRYFSARKHLSSKLARYGKKEEILIILYDLQTPLLKAISDLKAQYINLRLCIIVPDLHGYAGHKNSVLYNSFLRLEKQVLDNTYKSIDAYCLISKHMLERLPVGDKPWIVIEGIYNPTDEIKYSNNFSEHEKKVVYSGALNRRNGVNALLEAFSLIDNPNLQLILCGDGELKDEVLKLAQKDSRIKFKGQLKRSQVLKIQTDATLLVNPRTSNQEFTRYSFPSKTIEYYASGNPVIMYKLKGVPDEYYSYCYTPKDESIEELKKSILFICNMNDKTRKNMGSKAREFIIKEKNSFVQTKRLLLMSSKLFK